MTETILQKKLCAFSASLLLSVTGLVLIFTSVTIQKCVIKANMVLMPGSDTYDLWKHFPTRVPMDFHFFNWTNPEEIYNRTVKPKFEERGPYRFMVDMGKANVSWNSDGTVSYEQMRYWYYNPEQTRGDLQDKITCLNPVSLGTAHVARTWTYVVRRTVSLALKGLSSIHVTHTVSELLFDGYPETLIKISRTLPMFSKIEIPPWEKFAWFYTRNGSSEFEGVFTVGTGTGSVFGQLYKWNNRTKTPFFTGDCAKVDGSAGEIFDPDSIKESIKVFSTDLCRVMTLQYVGKSSVGGIKGNKYTFDDYMLDNGTKYPENRCYCDGECVPSGVFNVSTCRYGMPAFVSLPHFYKADPYYNNMIEGLRPDKEKHSFFVIVEPNTGVPLEVSVKLQLNMLLSPVPDITMYESVSKVLIPMVWFHQHVKIPDEQISMLKLLLNIHVICKSIGSLMCIVAAISFVYLFVVKKEKYVSQEDNVPLKTPR